MAIISFGPLVDGVRRSVGGSTFQAGASGPMVRSKPRPPTPHLASQRLSQSRMVTASQLWHTLSSASQSAWANYAATVKLTNSLNKTYFLTPAQMFTWLYTQQLIAGVGSPSTTAPTTPGLPALPTITLSWSGSILTVATCTPTPATGQFYIFRIWSPDFMRAFPRTSVYARTIIAGASSLPWTIATGLKAAIKTGTLARSHVWYRMLDTDYRCTTTVKTSIDWTAP
jgi:hypothetical protein